MSKNTDKYNKQHLRNLGLTEKQITAIYDSAVREATAIGASIHDFNPQKPFSFADYPQTKARIDKAIKELQTNVETIIVNSVRSEWTLANNKNNALCDWVFGNNKRNLSKAQERKYYNNNDKALDAFLKRKTAGLNLSNRVWNYTNQFKSEIEMGIDIGLRDGLPASDIARDLKQYLNQPDTLFRRVRDEHGQLHLSKVAKAYNPGAGVYRSSYKNAMRLARTENNIAYRTSDYERWQQLDFVVGIEVRLSNNHPFADICNDLAGKYPKTFNFTGWHPQCRCYAISILKTEKEMEADNKRIMNGEEPAADSVNSVKDIPDNFKKWVTDNEIRIIKANEKGSLPYFLKDNRSAWKNLTSVQYINVQKIKETRHFAAEFDNSSKTIAKNLGVTVTDVNLKSDKRIFEKAIVDYHGDVFRVNDIIRNTFIVPANKIPALISEIEKQFNVLEYNPQSTSMGYTGNLFKIWVRDGVKGEIHVNTPQMIYAKEKNAEQLLGSKLFNEIKTKSGLPHGLGHGYYEEDRVLSVAERQAEKGKGLVEKSKAYYEKIRAVKL
ncbi:MAG: hypothetical protein LBF08_07090 [Dysgonamonadaceae bacterium]|jgi:hypothetical protein|nr:hypothetical protein [Dysgonamonadaceae bacterium]